MKDIGLNVVHINLDQRRALPVAQGPDLVSMDNFTLARLDAILDRAAAAGLRVIITSVAGWQGIPPWYVHQRDGTTRRMVERYWQQLASRYAGNQTIMAWSLNIELQPDTKRRVRR